MAGVGGALLWDLDLESPASSNHFIKLWHGKAGLVSADTSILPFLSGRHAVREGGSKLGFDQRIRAKFAAPRTTPLRSSRTSGLTTFISARSGSPAPNTASMLRTHSTTDASARL